MGYRSTVGFAIKTEDVELFKSAAKEQLNGMSLNSILEWANDFKENKEFNYSSVVLNGVKWYDYDEMEFVEEFLHKHEGIFVRSGEDLDDWEVWSESKDVGPYDIFDYGTYIEQ